MKLAQKVVRQFGDQVEFHAIGRVPADGSLLLAMEALATKPCTERLSRSDFINGVKQLHFIIFPHEASNYKLNSSGTMLDALASAKPLIARRIPLFENMFLKYGDIGYLFSTDMELKAIVEHILEDVDIARYHQQILNIKRAQCSRTPQNLAMGYRDICTKIGFRPCDAESM